VCCQDGEEFYLREALFAVNAARERPPARIGVADDRRFEVTPAESVGYKWSLNPAEALRTTAKISRNH
jgi:hypothetical protein